MILSERGNIMLRKIFSICLVLLCLFCLVTPAFAVGEIELTESLINGLFWSLSRQVGITGENMGILTRDSTLDSVGLDDIVNGWVSWFTLSEIEELWDDIKADVTDLGTVRYSSGRTAPSMKVEITNENVNSVKRLAYSVQEYWKYRNNISTNSNLDWITIDEIFGGYLSHMEGFSGKLLLRSPGQDNSSNDLIVSYNETSGFFTMGMDLYEILGQDTYRQILKFDSDNDTVEILNNPTSGLKFTGTNGTRGKTRCFII